MFWLDCMCVNTKIKSALDCTEMRNRMQKVISTDKAPSAIGPYSQAIEINGMVYTSGVIPVDPATGVIADGVEAQAEPVSYTHLTLPTKLVV